MSEWIEWKGGKSPVRGAVTMVDIQLRDGSVMSSYSAGSLNWESLGYVGDIVAYRLSEQKSMEEAYDETTRGINADMDEPSALTEQHGGDHYTKMGDYQPWKVLREWLTPEEFRGYMKGNAITYLARERSKGGSLDVSKAAHTLDALIELEGK